MFFHWKYSFWVLPLAYAAGAVPIIRRRRQQGRSETEFVATGPIRSKKRIRHHGALWLAGIRSERTVVIGANMGEIEATRARTSAARRGWAIT
jgi:hypothetical protein